MLPKCAFSPSKEKMVQFRCTNLRNPEATSISETVTEHITLGYTDGGTGIGAAFSQARAC